MIQTYKGKRPQIDPSAFVHPMATLIGEVILGPRVSIWPGVVLRGDCGLIDIGADSNIQDGTVVHTTGGWSRTIIGERVTVGHNVVLHGCQVADDCLVGMGSVLLDNSRFGRHTMIAAGSVVPPGKEFLDGGLVMGNPATLKRPLGDHHREMIELGWRAYIEYSSAFIQGEVETIG